METLRMANEEETREIAQKLWDSESMQDYIIKNYDYYFTHDGLILELGKVKSISIDKTLWYDDEMEAPTNNKNTFINYNMRSNNPMRALENYIEQCKSLKENHCASGQYDYDGIYFRLSRTDSEAMVNCNWFGEKDKYFARYLTDEEQVFFIELMQNRKAQYLERLEKYYKRYSKNVFVSGYWANR